MKLIADLLQVKSLCIAGKACGLPSGKNFFDIFLFSRAETDFKKCANDHSCHVVKEVVSVNGNLHFFPIIIDFNFIDFPFCRLSLFYGRKALKIVTAC